MNTGQKQSSFASTVNEMLAIIGGAGALVYSTGFIIATLNLQANGFWIANLPNSRYIGVGLCYIAILSATIGAMYLVQYWFSEPWSERWRWKVVEFSLKCLCAICLIGLPLWFTLLLSITQLQLTQDAFQAASDSLKWFAAHWWSLGLWYACAAALGISLRSISRNWRFKKSTWRILAAFLLSLLGINRYAYAIYGELNPAFGGGRHWAVQLVLSEKAKQSVNALRLPMQRPLVTRLLGLIDENEKSYYLGVPSGKQRIDIPSQPEYSRSVELNKEAVTAVNWQTWDDDRWAQPAESPWNAIVSWLWSLTST